MLHWKPIFWGSSRSRAVLSDPKLTRCVFRTTFVPGHKDTEGPVRTQSPSPCTDQQARAALLTASGSNSCRPSGSPGLRHASPRRGPGAQPSPGHTEAAAGHRPAPVLGRWPLQCGRDCARTRLYPPTSHDTRTARSQRGRLSCKDTRRRVFTRKQNRKKTLGKMLKSQGTQETRCAG